MLFVHRHATESCGPHGEPRLERRMIRSGDTIPADTVWIDMVEPTREEDRLVEALIGVAVPTREDMDDIEPSELLYHEDGARFLTVRLLFNADEAEPAIAAVTFIIQRKMLITVRYDEPRAFSMFVTRAGKPGGCGLTAEAVMSGLFETIIDRAAEVLQDTGEKLDSVSRAIFESETRSKANRKKSGIRRAETYQRTLRHLGRHGDLISKIRESLVSIERALLFLSSSYRTSRVPLELREQVKTALRDIQSLEEHATFQSSKIQFLLEATLGLVNLEQNNIIKLFSVMAVIFMPPTLIASVYGMNFRAMPELDLTYGYPLALFAMVIAAIAPYLFFRWKHWL